MTEPPFERFDLDRARQAALHWEVDPDYFPWLRASFDDKTVHLRLNVEFPEVPLYSLLIWNGLTFDFTELPSSWTRTNELHWPDSAERDVSRHRDW